MDLKRYKKTRYQSIYKNIKNGNYLIVLPKLKTTITTIDGEKIFDINKAIEIRDNKAIRVKKRSQIAHKDTFEVLWSKYMIDCKNVQKMAYNSLRKKDILYHAKYEEYFRGKQVSKIAKTDIIAFIEKIDTTNKQKNLYLIQLKAFFNWCIKQEYIFTNPTIGIEKYKQEKRNLTYWLPEQLKQILTCINEDIEKYDDYNQFKAYTMKMLIIITFSLGNRLGETRALRYCDIDREKLQIQINHSIDWNPKTKTYLKETKTPKSHRTRDVSAKLIEEIDTYRNYISNRFKINITDEYFILFNPNTNAPYSDTALRKMYNYYIEKSGVPKIRMYDLRCTYAITMLNFENMDMWAVSSALGHSKITTTMEYYNETTNKLKKEMAKATEKYF